MEIEEAYKHIIDFRREDLSLIISELKDSLTRKTREEILHLQNNDLFSAASEIKKLSAQIDEIVHCIGIVNCLPKILEPNETIESVSLAAGDGFDLVTCKRIAEFKFTHFDSVKGVRKRHVFADFVKLLLAEEGKEKQLYVYNANEVILCFKSRNSEWRSVLSKAPRLKEKLEGYLNIRNIKAEYLNDIYTIAKIDIININSVLNQ